MPWQVRLLKLLKYCVSPLYNTVRINVFIKFNVIFFSNKLLSKDNDLQSRSSKQSCNEDEIKYIGCYTDDQNIGLEYGPKKYSYKIVTCNKVCSNYEYFALRNQGKCFCGDAYSARSGFYQVSDHECGGKRGLGQWRRNSIYQTCTITKGKP